MKKKRKGISPKVKQLIIKEAGMKCANPGCNNYRVHIHHIKEWAVYGTDDNKYLLAICPTCHDLVHHGRLEIDDDTLYLWKNIKRYPSKNDQIYIEPSDKSKLLLGSIAFTGNNGISIFELSPINKLSFKLLDGDIFLMNIMLSAPDGTVLFKVIENNIKYEINSSIHYERRPGKFRVSLLTADEFIPRWMINQIEDIDENVIIDNSLSLIDIEVLKPGVVKVEGLWINEDTAICISKNRLSFIKSGLLRPISLIGEGENTLIKYTGPINQSIFNFEGMKNKLVVLNNRT